MKPFRKAIFDVLNGTVSYSGSVVPIYDKKVHSGSQPTVYMYFGSQSETDATEQDCSYQYNSQLNLIIVAKNGSEVSQDTIDDIGDTVLQLLINAPGDDNLSQQPGFSIYELKLGSAAAGEVQISPTQSELQKILSLTAIIIQS